MTVTTAFGVSLALPEALIAQLDALTPTEMYRALTDIIQRVQGAQFEAIAEVEGVHRCPRCNETMGLDAIIAEDISTRWTRGDANPEEQSVEFCYDQRGEFETLAYLCGTCYIPMALPEGWTEKAE